MSCPTCRAADVVEIRLDLRGNSVTMRSCSHCETRWWEQAGERVALHRVLRLARPA